MKRIFQTPTDGHYFFGYYDKSPLNKDNSKILACKASFIDRMPSADDVLEIGYFDWKNSNEFIKLNETKAWNWQQGCMLQWLSPNYNEKIIYNDKVDKKFVTVIFDIKKNTKTILPMAYYTMSGNGDFVLCIDYERHYWFRSGYSYQGIVNEDKKKSIDYKYGIWKLLFKTSKLEQIIKMSELLNHKPLSNMKEAIHYLEHLMISPDNNRLSFLHRWNIKDGGIYARLYTVNVDGSDLHLLSDSGRMSHFCWRNKKEILAWGGIGNSFNSLRKYKNVVRYFIKPLLPLYKKFIGERSKIRSIFTGDSYLLFEDKTTNIKKIQPKVLREDGHPTFNPNNQDIFISDTYEQEDNHRELFLFNINTNNKVDIDRLYSMKEYDNSAIRCDLHPKWSYDGKYISIDTVNDGVRGIYIYDVSELVQ